MEWMFILLPFILLLLFKGPAPKDNKTLCTLHRWEYRVQPGDDTTTYLQCADCLHLPGSEEGEQL